MNLIIIKNLKLNIDLTDIKMDNFLEALILF